MIIQTLNREQFEANKAEKIIDIKYDLLQAAISQLRMVFDKSRLDYSAQACIDVAAELGFEELAAEMAADLNTELTEV